MSQIIAPGKWGETARKSSRLGSYVVGAVLLVVGVRWGNAVFAREDPSVWQIGAVVSVLLLAGSALLPGIVVPIVYRVIDKVGKDSGQ